LKIVHWSLSNGSGLNTVSYNISEAERELGYNSLFIPTDTMKDGVVDQSKWEDGMDADIHVVHSTLPDTIRNDKAKIVFVGHGTPEVCFQSATETPHNEGAWGLSFYWLRQADAVVTFWDRHKYIWESLMDKNSKVHCIPMGVNKEFWKPVESRGKYAGEPSLLSSENSHRIKWAYDLILAWPEVSKHLRKARLHINYLPTNLHKLFYSILYNNGTLFTSFIQGIKLAPDDLRNAFVSADYYFSHVSYGDSNVIGLEAKASGCKLISYTGNPYADYWISSSDQRVIARELV
jgi:hypothetical protein